MRDRRESNLVSASTSSLNIVETSSASYNPNPVAVNPISHSASAQALHEEPVGFEPPSYVKPNLNALGTNQKDTHFSSVKWGGTPNASLNNFTRTMKVRVLV